MYDFPQENYQELYEHVRHAAALAIAIQKHSSSSPQVREFAEEIIHAMEAAAKCGREGVVRLGSG